MKILQYQPQVSIQLGKLRHADLCTGKPEPVSVFRLQNVRRASHS